MIVAVAMRNT